MLARKTASCGLSRVPVFALSGLNGSPLPSYHPLIKIEARDAHCTAHFETLSISQPAKVFRVPAASIPINYSNWIRLDRWLRHSRTPDEISSTRGLQLHYYGIHWGALVGLGQ